MAELFTGRGALAVLWMFSNIVSADGQLPSCVDAQTLVTKLRAIRSLDWTKTNKERLQNLFDKKLENVFCEDTNNPDSCNALNFNEKIGNCSCNLTFEFNQNSNDFELSRIFIRYPVNGWTSAMRTSRDLVLSLSPLVDTAVLDPSVGWDIPETQNFKRTLSWKGRVEEWTGNTLSVKEENSVQLSVESCGKDLWEIQLYILPPN